MLWGLLLGITFKAKILLLSCVLQAECVFPGTSAVSHAVKAAIWYASQDEGIAAELCVAWSIPEPLGSRLAVPLAVCQTH